MKQIVINLLGGPGSGKSTIAYDLAGYLKKIGVNCEYISEFVKQRVYEKNQTAIDDQLYIFANQWYNMRVTRKEVEVLICDSPLYLSAFYNTRLIKNHKSTISQDVMIPLVKDCVDKFENLNYFIWRNHEYKEIGRYQTVDQAKEDEQDIYKLMKDMNVKLKELKSTDPCMQIITCDLIGLLEKRKSQNKEIERKYIVDKMPKDIKNKVEIMQAYFEGQNPEKRVRSVDNKQFFYTEKLGNGIERHEMEKAIDKNTFVNLFKDCSHGIIEKTRAFCTLNPVNGSECIAEINIYHGTLEGLKIVEVEFESIQDAKDFCPPDWFGKEVTNDPAFQNYNLAKNGLRVLKK